MGEMVRDYTATGKYKSENIPGNQYMEEHEREFFDKNAIVLERQAAIMAENYRSDKDDSLYDFIADLEEHEGEYVVDGALLACTRCSKQARKIKIDGVEFAGELRDVEINSRIYTGDRPQTINGLVPAGVKDSVGGMRGEEMITKIQGEEAGEVNIVSFGNCAFIPQGEELNKILLAQNMMHKKDKIIEAIKEGKGTCYCFMRLNEEWENLAIAGEYMVGEISTKKQQVNKSLLSAPYMKFNGVEGINMLSILFCQFGGGIIAALESGQDSYRNNFWTEEEMYILERIGDIYAYENWSEEKKRCAEEIWQRFYVEAGYDVYFVVGIIGNMYGEGSCGLLQDTEGWQGGIEGGTIIKNLDDAYAACIVTGSDFGVGMLQWSYYSRKEQLYNNYTLMSEDAILTSNEIIKAEIKTIQDELEGGYSSVYGTYKDHQNDCEGENISLATNVFFRDYEYSSEFRDVDEFTYNITEEAQKKAMNAQSEKEVPSIYRRNIAAKIAYEHFVGEG